MGQSPITLGISTIIGLEEAIRSAFTKFGTIKEIRLFGQQNYGFVIFDSKESATKAILAMSGQELSGQTIKCSWGRSSESVRLFFHDGTTSKVNVLEPKPYGERAGYH